MMLLINSKFVVMLANVLKNNFKVLIINYQFPINSKGRNYYGKR